MLTFIAVGVGLLALYVAAIALLGWIAGREYDAWISDMHSRGIKTTLEPVFMGSDIVGYTYVAERRSKAR